MPEGVGRGLGFVAGVDLPVEIGDVAFHGADADHHFPGGVPVAFFQ